ncbi:MAG: hypothetical protein A3I39_01670 [Candidatus Yanofskybacteria bacterium RIFCSPLOWO2_02_FULL_47_9b]|uniref:Uncharacterized protein n=1 Tax=Candidatus Yanofskybacteria bacterium RIFCSPLOWO2_02_FULL_47_9b TaxID=1802708 RepID=A0A1F8H8Z3_9BACT|nr:MAG: hypothetical protein A3I39_01670 [Candidatus Yanofskybacteria bacterium RIFCSPLOWO2_02_FULL_47_9b]
MYKINGGRVTITLVGDVETTHIARLKSGEINNQVLREAVKSAFRGQSDVQIDSITLYHQVLVPEFERAVRRCDECLATLRNFRMRMAKSQVSLDQRPFWDRWNELMAEWRKLMAQGYGNYTSIIEGVRELKADFIAAEEQAKYKAVAA